MPRLTALLLLAAACCGVDASGSGARSGDAIVRGRSAVDLSAKRTTPMRDPVEPLVATEAARAASNPQTPTQPLPSGAFIANASGGANTRIAAGGDAREAQALAANGPRASNFDFAPEVARRSAVDQTDTVAQPATSGAANSAIAPISLGKRASALAVTEVQTSAAAATRADRAMARPVSSSLPHAESRIVARQPTMRDAGPYTHRRVYRKTP